MSVQTFTSSCPTGLPSSSVPYVVLRLDKASGSSLLWSPKIMDKKFIRKPDAKPGDWYEICESTQTIWPSKRICDTRVREGMLEIKVPVVFFEASTYRNVVGLSPGFGHVGCFVPLNFKKERLCAAWVTYVEFFPSYDFQTLLNLFSVNWIIGKQTVVPMDGPELHYFSMCGCIKGLEVVRGLVVEKSGDQGQIYNEEHGVCEFKQDPVDENIALGSFVKFIPIRNLRNIVRATHVYSCSGIKGINCIETSPEIKLNVVCWGLNAADDRFICIPGLRSKVADESGRPKKRDPKKSLVVVYDRNYKDFHVPQDDRLRGSRNVQKFLTGSKMLEVNQSDPNESWW